MTRMCQHMKTKTHQNVTWTQVYFWMSSSMGNDGAQTGSFFKATFRQWLRWHDTKNLMETEFKINLSWIESKICRTTLECLDWTTGLIHNLKWRKFFRFFSHPKQFNKVKFSYSPNIWSKNSSTHAHWLEPKKINLQTRFVTVALCSRNVVAKGY